MPDGEDADALRRVILEGFDLSLGNGLGRLAGRVFRIGHLGEFNDLMLAGTLAGIEMGLRRFGRRANASGVVAALDHLAAERTVETAGRASAA
jgi:alanine-glyoxylate transaminase/serine-glyoxylate transaminase/serine-pyruvate transaminase